MSSEPNSLKVKLRTILVRAGRQQPGSGHTFNSSGQGVAFFAGFA
jgi:hypothetical protein